MDRVRTSHHVCELGSSLRDDRGPVRSRDGGWSESGKLMSVRRYVSTYFRVASFGGIADREKRSRDRVANDQHKTTRVNVDDDATSRLEEPQAEIQLRTGPQVTQEALLGRLIDEAYAAQVIIDSVREERDPLHEDEITRLRWGGMHSPTGDVVSPRIGRYVNYPGATMVPSMRHSSLSKRTMIRGSVSRTRHRSPSSNESDLLGS